MKIHHIAALAFSLLIAASVSAASFSIAAGTVSPQQWDGVGTFKTIDRVNKLSVDLQAESDEAVSTLRILIRPFHLERVKGVDNSDIELPVIDGEIYQQVNVQVGQLVQFQSNHGKTVVTVKRID